MVGVGKFIPICRNHPQMSPSKYARAVKGLCSGRNVFARESSNLSACIFFWALYITLCNLE